MGNKQVKQEVSEQERIQALEAVIAELLDELNWRSRTDHKQLAIRALQALGLERQEIIGYFQGNIIL